MAEQQKKKKSERKISQLKIVSESQGQASAKHQNNKILNNFYSTLKSGWQMGQIPLFLFGAKATPIDINHLKIANEILKDKKDDNSSVGTRFKLAQLFGELQRDKVKWNEFTSEFLRDFTSKRGEWHKKENPNPFYGKILNYLKKNIAISLTLNFDGALLEELRNAIDGEKPTGLYAIQSDKQLRSLALVDKEDKILPWALILRGDVYHGVCRNIRCTSHGHQIPIYELFNNDEKAENTANELHNKTSKDNSKKVITQMPACNDCGELMDLTISFPGLAIKDEEIHEVLRALWIVLGGRISLICSVGFSGDSDQEIVDFLLRVAKRLDIPWFHITRPNGNPERAVIKIGSTYDNFHLLPVGWDKICNSLPDEVPYEVKKSSDKTYTDSDHLWIKNTSGSEIHVTAQILKPGSKPKISTFTIKKEISSDLEALINENVAQEFNVRQALTSASQLSLQTYWWNPDGEKKLDKHTRFHHSLGTMRVARTWAKYLEKKAKNNSMLRKTLIKADDSVLLEAIQCAALLHDIGHMSFSHVVEDVFEELHWSLGTGKSFNHEGLAKIQLNKLRSKISKIFSINDGPDLYKQILRMIEGYSGITWIDCILNSPLDADKIDYLFRDQEWLELQGRLGEPTQWLADFLCDQRVSSEGHILLNGKSAIAAYSMLIERVYLYDVFYWAPYNRLMERLVKYVLLQYLTLKISQEITKESLALLKLGNGSLLLSMEDVYQKIDPSLKNMSSVPADLGLLKLFRAKQELDKIGSEADQNLKNSIPELAILECIGAWARDKERGGYRFDSPAEELGELCEILTNPRRTVDGIKPKERELGALKGGLWVKKIFHEHLIGTIFTVKAPDHRKTSIKALHWLLDKRVKLMKIGQQLTLEHPGRVVLDVAGPIKVLSYSKRRILKQPQRWDSNPFIAEQFFVPAGDPASWTSRSEAKIPLHEMELRNNLPQAYQLRIMLIDPTNNEAGRHAILDRFRLACQNQDIDIKEIQN